MATCLSDTHRPMLRRTDHKYDEQGLTTVPELITPGKLPRQDNTTGYPGEHQINQTATSTANRSSLDLQQNDSMVHSTGKKNLFSKLTTPSVATIHGRENTENTEPEIPPNQLEPLSVNNAVKLSPLKHIGVTAGVPSTVKPEMKPLINQQSSETSGNQGLKPPSSITSKEKTPNQVTKLQPPSIGTDQTSPKRVEQKTPNAKPAPSAAAGRGGKAAASSATADSVVGGVAGEIASSGIVGGTVAAARGTAGAGRGTAGTGRGSVGAGRGTAGTGSGTVGAVSGTVGAGSGTVGAGRGTTGTGSGTVGVGKGTTIAGRGTAATGRGTVGTGRGAPAGTGTVGAGRGTAEAGRGTAGQGSGTGSVGRTKTSVSSNLGPSVSLNIYFVLSQLDIPRLFSLNALNFTKFIFTKYK